MSNYEVFIQHDQQRINLQCQGNELMSNIIARYKTKSNLDVEKYFFVSNGMIISEDQTLQEVSKKETKVEILALLKQTRENVDFIKYSEYVKCGQCFEPAIIEFFKDYKIALSDKKHVKKKINLLDFMNTQLVDQRNIKCSNCPNTRDKTYSNQFYYCFERGKNFCPIC